jgi:hypothetical protein
MAAVVGVPVQAAGAVELELAALPAAEAAAAATAGSMRLAMTSRRTMVSTYRALRQSGGVVVALRVS